MPSSSLSWQQGLAGRNPAISFLTSAENEMPTTSQGWCPATRTLFLPSSPPKVQSTEPVTARAPGTDLQPLTLLALYHTMVMARAIERRLWVLRRLEKMDFPVRVAGFEVVQVAAAAALRPGRDWVVPCQLDLALCLALGTSPLDVMLGTFGSRAARVVTTPAAAGRHVLHAAGIAYAEQVSGGDGVTLVCTDRDALEAGDWHEGINFAGAHSLPLICLVEDLVNALPYAEHDNASPAARAEGYGLAAETIDGGDFEAALAAFRRAVARAQTKGGPTLIHAAVVELTSRAPGGGMRPPEELEALASLDPIDRMRRGLMAAGVLDEAADEQVGRECASTIAAAVDNVWSRDKEGGCDADDRGC